MAGKQQKTSKPNLDDSRQPVGLMDSQQAYGQWAMDQLGNDAYGALIASCDLYNRKPEFSLPERLHTMLTQRTPGHCWLEAVHQGEDGQWTIDELDASPYAAKRQVFEQGTPTQLLETRNTYVRNVFPLTEQGHLAATDHVNQVAMDKKSREAGGVHDKLWQNCTSVSRDILALTDNAQPNRVPPHDLGESALSILAHSPPGRDDRGGFLGMDHPHEFSELLIARNQGLGLDRCGNAPSSLGSQDLCPSAGDRSVAKDSQNVKQWSSLVLYNEGELPATDVAHLEDGQRFLWVDRGGRGVVYLCFKTPQAYQVARHVWFTPEIEAAFAQ